MNNTTDLQTRKDQEFQKLDKHIQVGYEIDRTKFDNMIDRGWSVNENRINWTEYTLDGGEKKCILNPTFTKRINDDIELDISENFTDGWYVVVKELYDFEVKDEDKMEVYLNREASLEWIDQLEKLLKK
jgi:hypothetical protein